LALGLSSQCEVFDLLCLTADFQPLTQLMHILFSDNWLLKNIYWFKPMILQHLSTMTHDIYLSNIMLSYSARKHINMHRRIHVMLK
jgi:hypothetical protein